MVPAVSAGSSVCHGFRAMAPTYLNQLHLAARLTVHEELGLTN
jgi:hypothetical protein